MTRVERLFPQLHYMFMKIAEPRITRLLYCGIYICLLTAGILTLFSPPSAYQGVLGVSLTLMVGGFLAFGGLLGTISVLPGIWWLERAGLFSLTTGVAMYLVILVVLRPSPVGYAISVAFVLTFIMRWLDIKGSQLAPREE